MSEFLVKHLTHEDIDNLLILVQELNPTIPTEALKARLTEMFGFENYRCFGLFIDNQLAGAASGWITVRLYSGKQLEVDNVIINGNIHSQGFGTRFLSTIESWAFENGCETVELNTYVQNDRSHKFYFNQGYKILGFHFQKQLEAHSDKHD